MGKEMGLDRITKEEVGFGLEEETKNLVRDLGESPLHKREILENTARQIRTYESETLEDSVVSYYPCFVHSVNGKTKLSSSSSPNEKYFLESQIDPLERDGAVTVGFNLLQKKIGETEGDKFFLWVSTKGSAGTQGMFKDINYGYHQVYFGKIKDNKTEAYALKSDIDQQVLADWIKSLSSGSVSVWENSPGESLQSPVVLPTFSEEHVLETAFYKLEELLEKKGQKNFYKSIDIYCVPQLIREERIKQQRDVRRIAGVLERSMSTDRDLGYEEARRAIGGQIYVLYDKYADEHGEVKLTGCAGGSITINNFLSRSNSLGLSALNNVFSTEFRLKSIGNQENQWFTCPKCNYEADGPVGNNCPKCGLTKEEYAKKGNRVC